MPSFNAPAVSVIIPVRNSGRYFQECLDSVTRQTLHNIEIIIIDDASTDGSDAVAEAYATQDSRITIIHHDESTGAGPARNDGMAIARGEYIAFMDSDDLYPSANILEILYNKAIEQNAIICGGSLYKINADGNIIDMRTPDQYFENEGWIKYRDYQYDGGFYRFLYQKNFLAQYHFQFPSRQKFEDPIFFVHVMLAAQKFYVIISPTYFYRKKHKANAWTKDEIIDHLDGLKELLKISNKENLARLHYLMAKNFLSCCHNQLKQISIYQRIIYLYKIFSEIYWPTIYSQNNKHKVKITIRKIFISFLF